MKTKHILTACLAGILTCCAALLASAQTPSYYGLNHSGTTEWASAEYLDSVYGEKAASAELSLEEYLRSVYQNNLIVGTDPIPAGAYIGLSDKNGTVHWYGKDTYTALASGKAAVDSSDGKVCRVNSDGSRGEVIEPLTGAAAPAAESESQKEEASAAPAAENTPAHDAVSAIKAHLGSRCTESTSVVPLITLHVSMPEGSEAVVSESSPAQLEIEVISASEAEMIVAAEDAEGVWHVVESEYNSAAGTLKIRLPFSSSRITAAMITG